MDLRFTDEQEMMRKMVRDFAQKEVAPRIESMENEEFPTEIIKRMGELGLMGVPVSEEQGGAGMDYTSYIIAINELSKVSATLGVILSVHTSVGTFPILKFGTKEQVDHYVPKLASGEYLGAFCLTEPGAGSDAGSLKTKAKKKAIITSLMDQKYSLQMVSMPIHSLFLRIQTQSKEIKALPLLSLKKVRQALRLENPKNGSSRFQYRFIEFRQYESIRKPTTRRRRRRL